MNPNPTDKPNTELEKDIRHILDTHHTVPVGQSHTDTYAPRIVKYINRRIEKEYRRGYADGWNKYNEAPYNSRELRKGIK